MKEFFEEEEQQRERSVFRLKNMIINGSLVLSLIFVTSILCPRHVRWHLLMCTFVMIWFICAVFFQNT